MPLRFSLTELAANTFKSIGADISVQGNWIYCDKDIFSIDEACAGLNSITYALLFAIIILITIERKHNLRFSILKIISYLSLMIGLIITGNFFRICILILFKIGPLAPMHNIVGVIYLCLSCFLFYLISLKISPSSNSTKTVSKKIWPILFLISISSCLIPQNEIKNQLPDYLINNALDKKITKNNTIQLSNDNLLIYVKPINSPFSAEHSPLLCWKASGYHVDQVIKERSGSFDYFKVTLKKGNESLTSIWWFEINNKQLLDQWDWRKEALLHPGALNLINITSENENDIKEFIIKAFTP